MNLDDMIDIFSGAIYIAFRIPLSTRNFNQLEASNLMLILWGCPNSKNGYPCCN